MALDADQVKARSARDGDLTPVLAGIVAGLLVLTIGIQLGIWWQREHLAGRPPEGLRTEAAVPGSAGDPPQPLLGSRSLTRALPVPIAEALTAECADEHVVAGMVQNMRMYVESAQLQNGDLRRARAAALAAAEATMARMCLDWWIAR